MEKHVCSVCRKTGHTGAEWVAQIGNDRIRVHKPCGQRLAETAPEGTGVKISPSPELRRTWENQRREREVRNFWEQKFATARAEQR